MRTKLLIGILLFVAFLGFKFYCSTGPFGPPRECPLLTPFSGKWVFDEEKTIVALKAAGASDAEIAQMRKIRADYPLLKYIHTGLRFDRNVAAGSGLLGTHYRFFGMHKHGSKICGKAWHHESWSDPGDMSKCYVRLEIIDGDLHLDVNMQDGFPSEDDPDMIAEPPVECEVEKCEIDTEGANKQGDWTTYVYSRPR